MQTGMEKCLHTFCWTKKWENVEGGHSNLHSSTSSFFFCGPVNLLLYSNRVLADFPLRVISQTQYILIRKAIVMHTHVCVCVLTDFAIYEVKKFFFTISYNFIIYMIIIQFLYFILTQQKYYKMVGSVIALKCFNLKNKIKFQFILQLHSSHPLCSL